MIEAELSKEVTNNLAQMFKNIGEGKGGVYVMTINDDTDEIEKFEHTTIGDAFKQVTP